MAGINSQIVIARAVSPLFDLIQADAGPRVELRDAPHLLVERAIDRPTVTHTWRLTQVGHDGLTLVTLTSEVAAASTPLAALRVALFTRPALLHWQARRLAALKAAAEGNDEP